MRGAHMSNINSKRSEARSWGRALLNSGALVLANSIKVRKNHKDDPVATKWLTGISVVAAAVTAAGVALLLTDDK